MTGEGAQTAQVRMEQYNDSADAPDLRTRRYRGTIASPLAVNSGDYLYRSNHEYYNGSALIVGGTFAFDNTNNANRTQFAVSVTTDGTSADANTPSKVQFKIDGNDSGAITFNNAYKFPTSDGSANQFLQTDGSGALTFASATVSDISDLTATATELNIIDGDTSATSTTLVDADRFVVNDGGTMVQVAASDVATYIGAASNVFKTISVAGQSDVVADSNTDTLTLAAGDGLTITTNAGTDTITFTASSSDSVFSANSDFASVADSVVTSEDLDLVTASTTDTYDLGTIAVQGIVVTTSIVDGNVTTAKIADDAITSVKLSGLTNASSGIIQADGDGTFSINAGGISNVVDDITPQLGGNLDTNGNDITFGDNDKAIFGAGDDLQIYHDGSNSFIDDAGTGNLQIRASSQINLQKYTGENMFVGIADGAASMYYDNSQKIATTATGVDVTGVADISGHVEAIGVEETVYDLGTTGGTITPNFTNGAIQKITLNANLTFSAFTSPVAGQSITLIIDTNGTGRTLTSTMLFAGGNKTMSTTDTTDVMTVLYDGTNYLANYVTDFS